MYYITKPFRTFVKRANYIEIKKLLYAKAKNNVN